jgi:hypothetical protein
MDRETIIRLAREAEGHAYTNRFAKDEPAFAFGIERLERFAALVSAAEREACIALKAGALFILGDKPPLEATDIVEWYCEAIRARGAAPAAQEGS